MTITEDQLKAARQLAREWARRDLDMNEAGKLLAYLRLHHNWRQCLTLAKRLADRGAVRSNRTRGYYQTLYETCTAHIGPDATPEHAGLVLGWAFRLGRYEKIRG